MKKIGYKLFTWLHRKKISDGNRKGLVQPAADQPVPQNQREWLGLPTGRVPFCFFRKTAFKKV